MTTKPACRVLPLCFTDGVPRRSFAVALVVGTMLTLINQGDSLFSGRGLNLLKAALTYFVPYCVATYGAVSQQLAAQRASRAGTAPVIAPRLRKDRTS